MAEKPIPPPSKLSERIVYFRDRREWSGLRLAKETGIPQTTLSEWERNGARIDELVDRLRAIAQALNLTLSELLGEEPPIPRDLKSGTFLVDLDDFEVVRRGERLPRGRSWYWVVPDRMEVCTAKRYADMERLLPRNAWRPEKR